ncbi:hypothetical protein AQI88_38790 [Streptomyces cellostaticus]|uniref:Uncharacterized protein n=1 Tax=Streptomyces cellostaticus TaxID=67285 RepID=A0A101NBR8_9ACTN|nr:hypothetical protein [Streptomyces cellostaticus]KUM90253.1 hypothetical protein AQI88_38790 [Streptomyces cellostaticus]
MTNDEFDAFLRYLAEEYLERRLPITRRRLRHHFEDEIGWTLDQLREAHQALNYIHDAMPRDEDIYETFTLDALTEIIEHASHGVRFQNRLAEDAGLMEVMDEYFTDLASGLRADHLPSIEADMLSTLGFPRVGAHLPALICALKIFSQKRPAYLNEVSVSQQLRDLQERLDQARQEHRAAARSDEEEPPLQKRKRKWWTGLGKVVAGSAISIADIGLGAGLIPFEVSPETRSWGALSSATLGIGQVMEGVGAIRGE